MERQRAITRRAALRLLGGGMLGGLLLSACGGNATPTPTRAPSSAASPTAAATPTPAQAATATPATTTATAATSPTVIVTTQASSQGPVLVGVLGDLSGTYSSLGQNVLRGMQLYLEQVQNKGGGRPIELHSEDCAGSPDQTLSKTRKLVEQDRVHILAGVTLSNEAAAIRDYVVQQQVPLIVANAGWQPLTRDPKVRSPYLFRVSFANGQYEAPFGDYAYNKLAYKRVILTALDYSAGHEKADAFRKRFEQAGGKIAGEVYVPMNTQDFGPYLQRIQQYQADAVWAFYSGADAVRFVLQYTDFGLKDKFPLTGAGDTVDENILNQEGDAALNVVTSLHYSPLYNSPENKAFVDAFRAKYNAQANQFAYQGYLAARVIVEALNATGGKVEDKQAFLQALRQVHFTGPTGEFRFNPESQGPIITVLIRKVQKLPDGSYGNVVIDTIGNVDDLSF